MKTKKLITAIMILLFAGTSCRVQTIDNRILRDPQPKDFANVYWEAPYTLFDLLTDEPIFPDFENRRKIYKIYYSSNENPRVFYGEFTINSLQNHLFYKFKNEENCQDWCDRKNGIVK